MPLIYIGCLLKLNPMDLDALKFNMVNRNTDIVIFEYVRGCDSNVSNLSPLQRILFDALVKCLKRHDGTTGIVTAPMVALALVNAPHAVAGLKRWLKMCRYEDPPPIFKTTLVRIYLHGIQLRLQ